MGRWGDGEMGRWGDGEMRRQGDTVRVGLVDNLCQPYTISGQNPPLQLKTQNSKLSLVSSPQFHL